MPDSLPSELAAPLLCAGINHDNDNNKQNDSKYDNSNSHSNTSINNDYDTYNTNANQ